MDDDDKVFVEIDILGQLRRVPLSRKDAEWHEAAVRAFAVRLVERRAHAQQAIDQIELSESSAHESAIAAAARAIEKCCFMVDSSKRLAIFLDLVESAPSYLFWTTFMNIWSSVDNTWSDRVRLMRALRKHAGQLSAYTFMSKDQQRAIDDLPDPVTVYRGCSRRRVMALSWTLRRDVAEGFARGHRGISVPQSIVASGQIKKAGVFVFVSDRDEAELLIDPKRVTSMVTTKFP